jgi:hypothetical protein
MLTGMHKDGEETVGSWAHATRRSSLAHKQQLALVTAGEQLKASYTSRRRRA